MRWLTLLLSLVLAACAGSTKSDPQSLYYRGHCINAQIGGENFLADCRGILATLEYPSGKSVISFLLTGDRLVMFFLSNDSAFHPSATSWITQSASLMTGSQGRDYQRVVVICSRTREVPVPKFIECVGQAEGKAASFSFQTDGTPPIAGDGQNQ